MYIFPRYILFYIPFTYLLRGIFYIQKFLFLALNQGSPDGAKILGRRLLRMQKAENRKCSQKYNCNQTSSFRNKNEDAGRNKKIKCRTFEKVADLL